MSSTATAFIPSWKSTASRSGDTFGSPTRAVGTPWARRMFASVAPDSPAIGVWARCSSDSQQRIAEVMIAASVSVAVPGIVTVFEHAASAPISAASRATSAVNARAASAGSVRGLIRRSMWNRQTAGVNATRCGHPASPTSTAARCAC